MASLYSRFWVNVTIVLSVVFAVLFFPEMNHRYGFLRSVLLTAAGVIFIWIIYIIRAYIFTHIWPDDTENNTEERET